MCLAEGSDRQQVQNAQGKIYGVNQGIGVGDVVR